MKDYFYNKFPGQLRKVEFQRPNEIEREIFEDENILFFGGPDWEGVSDDLSTVPLIDRPYFILSLLMVVLTDQCIYTYFQGSYTTWKNQTNFPKFGWSGFGPHDENPLKVLWAPEREMVIEPDDIVDILPEFVTFYMDDTERFFTENLPHIVHPDFINSIIHDRAYGFNEGRIVQSFKDEFERQNAAR